MAALPRRRFSGFFVALLLSMTLPLICIFPDCETTAWLIFVMCLLMRRIRTAFSILVAPSLRSKGGRGILYSFFLLLLLLAHRATAQNAPVTPVTNITLGHSVVALTGPWKFHIGDSPQANGRRGDPRWAQPDYDDSAWGAMDLTPPPGSYDPVIGSSGFVPGWTARGYKGYSGYAWYRLRVNVQDGQSALALKMPYLIDDAYQVYVNGRMVGEFGRFTARGVTAYENQPHAFSLPAAATSGHPPK